MRKIRSILAMVLVVVMSLSVVVSASAAEVEADGAAQTPASTVAATTGDDNGGVMPLSTNFYWIGTSYVTIARNNNGINGDIYIEMTAAKSIPNGDDYMGFTHGVGIILFDRNGNIFDRRDDIFGAQNHGHFWCGSNIVRVDMRIGAKPFGDTTDKYEVKVTY